MNPEAKAVLVVDDESAVRSLVSTMLSMQGFCVFEAQNGLEALQVYASYHTLIALVITDVQMPVMTGPEALDRMQTISPDLRAIVMTGASPDTVTGLNGHPVLRKPFTPVQFRAQVRLALGQD